MNIIVTGASRGIGYEIVKQLSANSNNHVIAIARDKVKLQKLKEDCLSVNASAQVTIIPFDLNTSTINEELIPSILARVNAVDVLINNAGTLLNKPFEEITAKELFYVYNVNVFSIIQLTQALIPYMGKVEKSHIVNISSMGGFQGSAKFSGLSAYSSSKAALANLSECLSEELKERNIAVNCLALGAVQTEMLKEAFPEFNALVSATQMAEFIANFALTGHQYFNGKVLPVSLSTP